MSKKQDMIEKNIELSSEFSRYLFDHPEIQKKIPLDVEIILLPEFDQELKEHNLQLGKSVESQGGKVLFIIIKNLRAKSLSRIEEIELSNAA